MGQQELEKGSSGDPLDEELGINCGGQVNLHTC